MEGVKNRLGRMSKSSMKVSTLGESLTSCDTQNKNEKEKREKPCMGNVKARPGMGRSQSMYRIGELARARRQKGIRRKLSLELEPEGDKMEFERCVKIRFFDVEVRNYDVVASDHPGVSGGVAVEVR